MIDQPILIVIGEQPLRPCTFAHCDLAVRTVRHVAARYPANCVVDELQGIEAEVWIEGIVKLTFGESSPSETWRSSLSAGVHVRSNDKGLAVWCDPMGEHPLATTMQAVTEVGEVFWARLI